MSERHNNSELPIEELTARFKELTDLAEIPRPSEKLEAIRTELAYLSFELNWRREDAVV